MRRISRVGAIAAALALLVGVPAGAASAAPATTTIRGTVEVGGHPLAGVRVGTWSPSRGRLAEGRTDARGAFVLRSPSGVAVDVWAGSSPAAGHAVFAAGDQHLVRGVIGAAAPAGTASALWQRVTPAPPSRLDAGHAIRFRLQRAGRFLSPLADGGTSRIALDRGGLVSHWRKAQGGTIDSGWLVPGRYLVYWDPGAGRLATRTRVDVPAGTTRITPPVLPAAATVSIHVTSGGKPVGAGVPVVLLVPSGELPSGRTDASGTVVIGGLGPGTSTYVVGRYRSPSDEDPAGPPTSDDYLPAAPLSVTVAAGRTSATAAVDLRPAAHVTGRVAERAGHPVRVIAEDGDGNAVRSTTAADGAFALGGLAAGVYRVIAEDVDAATYASARIEVAAGASAAVPQLLVPGTPDPVVSGRVAGGPGLLYLRSPIDPRILNVVRDWGRSGRFRVPVMPGRYRPVVFGDGRTQAAEAPVTVTASRPLRLAPAPRAATVRLRPEVRGVPVPVLLRLHGPRIAVEEFLEGPQYSDVYSTGTVRGGVGVGGLPAGAYRVIGLDGPVPAADGPWSYRPAPVAFRLAAGRTTNVGAVRVGIGD